MASLFPAQVFSKAILGSFFLLSCGGSGAAYWGGRGVGESVAGAGPTKARPQRVHRKPRTGENGAPPARNYTLAQVARLVAGSLQALGQAAPMAQTWNQSWVPLVRPVTVQLEALPT